MLNPQGSILVSGGMAIDNTLRRYKTIVPVTPAVRIANGSVAEVPAKPAGTMQLLATRQGINEP